MSKDAILPVTGGHHAGRSPSDVPHPGRFPIGQIGTMLDARLEGDEWVIVALETGTDAEWPIETERPVAGSIRVKCGDSPDRTFDELHRFLNSIYAAALFRGADSR